ncbi:MAG TPA: hypothetical protein VJX48_02575 [Xanthobacteraceae bacterium]|nr:hypothetical protein [Xanthobacteraceae bacterium]
MTSEPDSTPRRRPPTIDLTAKEVESDAPSSAPGSAAADAAEARTAQDDAPGKRKDANFLTSVKPYAVGAIAGAIVVGAIIAGLWTAGLVPPHEVAATPGAQGAKAVSTDEMSSRLDKIQQAPQAPQPDQALAAGVAAAEAQFKSLSDSLAALNRRLDEVAAASQSALAQAKAAADGMKNAAQTDVQRSDIDTLNNRITALESTVKSLSADVAQRTSSADDRAARLTVAAEALHAAVERGAPYQAELAAVKALGADQNATAPLEPFAANGVPNATALAHELSMLTPSLLQASGAAPGESSFLGRLETHAQKLVRITPIDAPAGDDPSSVIARINIDAARGDITAALAGIARLPDATRALTAAWVKKAEAREAAIAASRRIAADALAVLGRPAPQ